MNMRNIKPIDFWTPDGTKTADKVMLYNFHGYNFDGTESWVSYRVGRSDSDGEKHSFSVFSEGSVSVPDEIVQSWGSDDECIFDHVIATLNLERQ